MKIKTTIKEQYDLERKGLRRINNMISYMRIMNMKDKDILKFTLELSKLISKYKYLIKYNVK